MAGPRPLRLAILECGNPPPGVEARMGGYGAVFADLFGRAVASAPASAAGSPARAPGPTLALSAHDVTKPEASYPSLDDVDGVLLTGSRHDAYASDAWIVRLVDFVGRALAHGRVRVVGVCFGHQIVARALGAPVAPNRAGWEVGVTAMRVSETGRAVFGREVLKLHQMHRDIVERLPPGAVLLAETDVCEVQAFLVPGRALAVQGHPEFTQDITTEILETRLKAGIHSRDVYERGMRTAALDHDGVRVANVFLDFLQEL